MTQLSGWQHIVYVLIKSQFQNEPFTLKELYVFEPFFRSVYPKNFHIKDKLRQTLQILRDNDFLTFLNRGVYQLVENSQEMVKKTEVQEDVVYLLSNEAIPGWVKIGRTNELDRRLKELYNTSVPLPFKVESTLKTYSMSEGVVLEKSIHEIIDTINPNLRKITEAKRREFFMLSVEEGLNVFRLVSKIMGLERLHEQAQVNIV